VSIGLVSKGNGTSMGVSLVEIWRGGAMTGGVGGSGLLRSELALSLETGDPAGGVAENSENATVCGVLAVTSLP
jgi:hypothetical protein